MLKILSETLKYPYSRLVHWIALLIISSIVVAVATWGAANLQIFASLSPELQGALTESQAYNNFAYRLTLWLTFYNALLGALVFTICSFLFRNFSKINMHLPFIIRK